MNCKLCANYLHTDKNTSVALLELLSWLKQTVQVYTKPVYCTIVHKTGLLYKSTQNQFMVQVYTKPVYCTSVHKTSSPCKCTQNQFTVQVYTKLVYWLIMKGMYMERTFLRNVQGRNITKVKECTGMEHYQG